MKDLRELLTQLSSKNKVAKAALFAAKDFDQIPCESIQCLDEKTLLLFGKSEVRYMRIVSLVEIQAGFQIESCQLSMGPTRVENKEDTLLLGPPFYSNEVDPSIISQMNELTQYLKPWDQTTFWAGRQKDVHRRQRH